MLVDDFVEQLNCLSLCEGRAVSGGNSKKLARNGKGDVEQLLKSETKSNRHFYTSLYSIQSTFEYSRRSKYRTRDCSRSSVLLVFQTLHLRSRCWYVECCDTCNYVVTSLTSFIICPNISHVQAEMMSSRNCGHMLRGCGQSYRKLVLRQLT